MQITAVPRPSAGAMPPEPLRQRGRARRCDPLREYRDERDRARAQWRNPGAANVSEVIQRVIRNAAAIDTTGDAASNRRDEILDATSTSGGKPCPSR
jgi:hypothetical protein